MPEDQNNSRFPLYLFNRESECHEEKCATCGMYFSTYIKKALYRCRMDCGAWADVAPSLATIHQRTQFFDFSIFSPLHTFKSIFLYKIGVYDPDLAYTIKPKTLQTLNPILNPIP
jgi:hypothetical protein